MSTRYHSDGTPKPDPGAPLAVCDGCARIRDDEDAGTACQCGSTDVQFIPLWEARAVARGEI